MKRRKALSLLLSLAIVLSLVLPVTTAFAADGDTDEGETKTSGLNINKTAVYDAKTGTYTIMLEAYATGESATTTVKQDVPTDVILLLDTSGSMGSRMSTISYQAYTDKRNSNFHSHRHNGGDANLWYKDGNKYYSVSVQTKQEPTYTPLGNLVNYEVNYDTYWWGSLTEDCYYYYANSLYEKVGEDYKPVTVTRSDWGRVYTYTFSDGTTITSTGNDGTPNFGNHAPLYTKTVDDSKTVYTYTYTDSNGVQQTIGTSVGASTSFTETTLYSRQTSSSNTTRLEALQIAVNGFVQSVAEKSKGNDGVYGTDDDVNHRIAVVEFIDYATNLTNGLVDMDNANGLTTVTRAVNGLNAGGNTNPSTALVMANDIFASNPVDSGKRNRVVILFTDGYPAGEGTDDIDYGWCDNAISRANTSKNTYKATVYTVGIFDGANPDSDIDTNFSYNSTGTTQQLVAANRYMHYTSSNYPNAQSLRNGGDRTGNGYYLSAADMDTLNSIFQQISNNIETGGSSTTLTDSTVIRDIVAQAFTMPENTTDVKVYTEDSDGSVNSWTNRQELKLADGSSPVSIDTVNRTVSVTGFSYKDNWCGNETINGQQTFHNGKKLIIEFTVQPKAGFLGGNDVFTNDGAGIYENAESKDPLMEFNKPTVNVPIKDVAVTATDKNVYLLGKVTLDQLKSGSTITVGAKEGVSEGIKLDLSKDNYGLEPWQTAYVTITAKIKDENGNEITGDLSSLVDDKEYTVEVTVEPTNPNPVSTEGTKAEAKTGKNEPAAKINVFKPELTYKDSTAYYGETVPVNNDYSGNLDSTVWKHGETVADENAMGAAPALAIDYTADASKIENGKYTKQDVPVKATVKIGTENVNEHTTFVHQDCTGKTCTLPEGGYHFWIHIQTCTLTITKTGGAAGDPYVFEVKKDGQPYTEVTVKSGESVEIVELPVGTYTITEKTDWSWRYTPSYSNDGKAELAASAPNGEIICTNTSNTDKWLNDYAVKSNTYQTGTPATDGNN